MGLPGKETIEELLINIRNYYILYDDFLIFLYLYCLYVSLLYLINTISASTIKNFVSLT
jgi:hypothetical protein